MPKNPGTFCHYEFTGSTGIAEYISPLNAPQSRVHFATTASLTISLLPPPHPLPKQSCDLSGLPVNDYPPMQQTRKAFCKTCCVQALCAMTDPVRASKSRSMHMDSNHFYIVKLRRRQKNWPSLASLQEYYAMSMYLLLLPLSLLPVGAICGSMQLRRLAGGHSGTRMD